MADSISILNLLSQALLDYLIEKMFTDVEDENTAVGLVKIGKLQSDPTTLVSNLMILHSEDPHTIHKDGDMGIGLPTYMIGGGYHAYWKRYFRIKFDLFWLGNAPSRDEARQLTYVIVSRAQHVLSTMPIPDVTDDFGESPSMIVVESVAPRESGGPPASLIWKVDIKLYFITEIDSSLAI